MLKAAAKVCTVLFVLTYFSVQCHSLEIHYEQVENNDLSDDEFLYAPEAVNYVGKFYEDPVTEVPKQPEDDLLKLLFGDNLYQGHIENNEIEDGPVGNEVDAQAALKNRVVRQAYNSGQAHLYPKLPSSSPYNQQYPNNNNQNPQWQPANNYSQQGYPSNGVSNVSPTAQQNSPYGHNPYNQNQGQNPYNNNHPTSTSYPGYRPPNSTVYNSGSSRPPYNQYGQFSNNTYPGYPPKQPGFGPGNTVNPYNPSQMPLYSPTNPSNSHSVIFNNNTSNRPQYSNNRTTNWFGNSGPNVTPPYNAPNGQNSQHFSSYPNNPYGQQNSTFSHQPTQPNHNPHQNPSIGVQYPTYNTNNNNNAGPYGQNPQTSNSYPQGTNQNPYNNPSSGQYGGPGNSHGPNTFHSNLANGYNPSVPSQPPYGSGPSQGNYRYPAGTNSIAHDPTRVSPEYFSYPH